MSPGRSDDRFHLYVQRVIRHMLTFLLRAAHGPHLQKEARLKVTSIVFLVALLLCPTFSAQTKSGTVCVIPDSYKPPTRIAPAGNTIRRRSYLKYIRAQRFT